MPRSNSSFGVADGGKVVSAALAPAPPAEKLANRCCQDRAARRRHVRRARRPALQPGSEAGHRQARAARPAHSDFGWDRRHRRGVGPVPAARLPAPGRSAPGRDLLARIPAGPVAAGRLDRAGSEPPRRCWAGKPRLTAGRDLRAALKHLQAIFELAVAILQFLVLAGELPQLILELLNAHRRIFVIGLRQDCCAETCCTNLRTKRQHRRHCRDAGNSMKSG